MAQVILVAASGLARETLESIRQTGDHKVVGILDDNRRIHGQLLGGVPVLGGLELAAQRPEKLLVCAGKGSARQGIVERLNFEPTRYATHVHASAHLGGTVKPGPGTIILAGCVATCDIQLGQHVVLMPNVVLTHDDVLGDHVTLAAGVTLSGGVRVGNRAYLGTNAAVRELVHIGNSAVLGMGSALLRDLPAGQVWAGNPARQLPRKVFEPEPNGHWKSCNHAVALRGAKA